MVHRFLINPRSIVFAVGELWAWARGNRRRVRVSGRSMLPTLHDGDDVLIRLIAPTPGDVIVATHPDPSRTTVLVKRLDAITASGSLVVRSDNAEEGTDSRTFGPIRADTVIGVATLRLNSFRALSVSAP